MLRLILNVLWLIFGGGIVICLEYLIGGALLCLTIVGIPFGLQCFKIAKLAFYPFGADIVGTPHGLARGALGLVLNVLWCLVAGLWIFLSHVVLAIGLAVTIIGIPFAWQHAKLAILALAPFGQRVV